MSCSFVMMSTKLIDFASTMMICAVVALPVGGALFRPSLRNAASAKFSRDARRNEPLSPAGTRTEQTDFDAFVDLLQLGSSQKAHVTVTLAGKLPSTSSTLPPPPPFPLPPCVVVVDFSRKSVAQKMLPPIFIRP